jgi:hypothetical protein
MARHAARKQGSLRPPQGASQGVSLQTSNVKTYLSRVVWVMPTQPHAVAVRMGVREEAAARHVAIWGA